MSPINAGDTALVLVSAGLVLLMTPGLALFYGGLVRSKNVVHTMLLSIVCMSLVGVLWALVQYSLAFSPGPGALDAVVGGLSWAGLRGVGAAPEPSLSPTIPHAAFMLFQAMFAVITPALVSGAIVERVRVKAYVLFVAAWSLVVYAPVAHSVWAPGGWLRRLGALDFAGGTVVHMSSGWSALVLCLMLGKRKGFGTTPFYPHSLVLTMIGTGMLWVGWYGFNAGSAVAADGIAAGAFTATTLATAVATVVWPALEWFTRGKPTVLGFCSGAVAGLVVITPASGYVTPNGAVLIGLLAGIAPFLACTKLKAMFDYDDALDTFGVHGVGGTLGALVTGFVATEKANPNLKTNLSGIVGHSLWLEQLKAMGLTIAVAVTGTLVLGALVRATIGLRPEADREEEGLDQTDHGEAGYHLDQAGG